MAFIYNVSESDARVVCDQGILCTLGELGEALMRGFDEALKEELQLFAKYSLDEFDVLRPRIRERYNHVAVGMKHWLETHAKCGSCTKYMMESLESTEGGNYERLDVGFWTVYGPHIKDVLFPHVTCGFRARTIKVASLEVKFNNKEKVLSFIKTLF